MIIEINFEGNRNEIEEFLKYVAGEIEKGFFSGEGWKLEGEEEDETKK